MRQKIKNDTSSHAKNCVNTVTYRMSLGIARQVVVRRGYQEGTMSNILAKDERSGAPGAAGTRLRNAMSVDVEDYFHVSALAESVSRDDWKSMEYRAEDSTRRLMRLFDDEGAKATFFILGWVAKKSPGLIPVKFKGFPVHT